MYSQVTCWKMFFLLLRLMLRLLVNNSICIAALACFCISLSRAPVRLRSAVAKLRTPEEGFATRMIFLFLQKPVLFYSSVSFFFFLVIWNSEVWKFGTYKIVNSESFAVMSCLFMVVTVTVGVKILAERKRERVLF